MGSLLIKVVVCDVGSRRAAGGVDPALAAALDVVVDEPSVALGRASGVRHVSLRSLAAPRA